MLKIMFKESDSQQKVSKFLIIKAMLRHLFCIFYFCLKHVFWPWNARFYTLISRHQENGNKKKQENQRGQELLHNDEQHGSESVCSVLVEYTLVQFTSNSRFLLRGPCASLSKFIPFYFK